MLRYPLLTWILLFATAGLTSLRAQPDVRIDDADAFLKSWQPVDLPPALVDEKIKGNVVVEFVVDETGIVTSASATSSTDERMNDAALASVLQWTFEPAVRDGQPVASALRVPVIFPLDADARRSLMPPAMPQPLPFVSPKVKRYGRTAEPEVVARRMLGGQVVLHFTVDTEGKASTPRVLAASCPELIRPAIDSLMATEFNPARQGTIALPAATSAPFDFALFGENTIDRLKANGIRPADTDDWAGFDELPLPLSYADPVYPRDLLLAGTGGDAEVRFTLTRRGAVKDVTVLSASAPEFGQALAAVLPLWSFRPIRQREDGSAEVSLRLRHSFTPPAANATLPEARLASLLAPDGPGIGTAKGLDARLKPLFQIAVVPPDDLTANEASATIEFIIDRDGRARLPRVREATTESFGWAAATAVAQWLFERPTRNGEAVDVRVAIPVSFTR